MCILSVYTLLNVVGYYDLSVLSMSVMGFQKKVWMEGDGWGELYPNCFGIFGIFFTLQSPLDRRQTILDNVVYIISYIQFVISRNSNST